MTGEEWAMELNTLTLDMITEIINDIEAIKRKEELKCSTNKK